MITDEQFNTFLSQLAPTNFHLKDYTDFEKVISNTKQIEMKLNTLNYLIGKENLDEAIEDLYNDNPKVFSVLDILLAVRKKDKKMCINEQNDFVLIDSYLHSIDGVKSFIHETGLAEVFINKNVKNLVDYVFGVEVGLDTNARKNRSGQLMAGIVAKIFDDNDISYKTEVSSELYPEINAEFGDDTKVFDFVIEKPNTKYFIEVNFYSGGGSKLNEVARSFSKISPLINRHSGNKFIWITDGKGWETAKSKLKEAMDIVDYVYNLTTIKSLIDEIKND